MKNPRNNKMKASPPAKTIAYSTGPAPTWPLPHGKGQGPRPDPNKHLPPLKKA
tara:strand:+ start:553 stop:711 length:159 start_codon:yes stop_codon:yes gene_type:complete